MAVSSIRLCVAAATGNYPPYFEEIWLTITVRSVLSIEAIEYEQIAIKQKHPDTSYRRKKMNHKSKVKNVLWPRESGMIWGRLFNVCEDLGQTMYRPTVVVHASSDAQGNFNIPLTETLTRKSCGFGLVFGDFALRQGGDSLSSWWEVVQNYQKWEEQEVIVLIIKSWEDLESHPEIDEALANGISELKAKKQKKRDAFLASLPEPSRAQGVTATPKKVDWSNDEHVDWDDFDEDELHCDECGVLIEKGSTCGPCRRFGLLDD